MEEERYVPRGESMGKFSELLEAARGVSAGSTAEKEKSAAVTKSAKSAKGAKTPSAAALDKISGKKPVAQFNGESEKKPIPEEERRRLLMQFRTDRDNFRGMANGEPFTDADKEWLKKVRSRLQGAYPIRLFDPKREEAVRGFFKSARSALDALLVGNEDIGAFPKGAAKRERITQVHDLMSHIYSD